MIAKDFKVFNVYNEKDKKKMEDHVSSYLTDLWKIESFESEQKKDIDGNIFTEYRIVMNENGSCGE